VRSAVWPRWILLLVLLPCACQACSRNVAGPPPEEMQKLTREERWEQNQRFREELDQASRVDPDVARKSGEKRLSTRRMARRPRPCSPAQDLTACAIRLGPA